MTPMHLPVSASKPLGMISYFCHVLFFAMLWTIAHQAPLSMGFSRQEYWGGLPIPSPGDLPDPGIEPGSPAFQEDSLPTELRGKPLINTVVSNY